MLSQREQRELRALRQRKRREAEGLFLAEGVRAVEDLLRSPLRVRFLAAASSLGDGERGLALLREAGAGHVPVREVSDAELREYAGTDTPQGVIAVAEVPARALSDLAPAHGRAAVLALDAVQDPGNFGTLVRTAEALGASGVLVLPGTVDPWNPKSVRAAMGSSFRLPVASAAWDEAEGWIRAAGLTVLAAAAGGEALPSSPPERAVLVVGNEGAGISDGTRRLADHVVGIPLRGRAESLNVGAAGAILLHELLR